MGNCSRLFPADNIVAFYSAPLKVLVIFGRSIYRPTLGSGPDLSQSAGAALARASSS